MTGRVARKAIAGLASRTRVREHEILRVTGTLTGSDSERCAELARGHVLQWAQSHCGDELPEAAWAHEEFEHFSGGRNGIGVRIKNDKVDIWALRSDDPDKRIPQRVWTTEVVIAVFGGELGRVGVRLLVSTPEKDLDIEPHTPKFVHVIAENCGLVRGKCIIDAEPWLIRDEAEFERFYEMLVDPARPLPFFVLSVPEDASDPIIDGAALSRAVIGLAQVIVLPDELTWMLTERLGMRRSVFGGAIRAYLPGFGTASNPYDHRLILPRQLGATRGAAQASRWMRTLAARESVRGSSLGRDTLAFSSVRSAVLQLQRQQLVEEGATEGQLLAAANVQVSALEAQIAEEKAAQDYYVSEHDRAEERAQSAEEQLRAAAYRIQELTDRLGNAGESIDEPQMPAAWEDFAGWADTNLAGRLVLSPAARRQTRAPQFEDVELAARGLHWLATECRDRRLNGGEGSLRDEPIESGVRNAPCGNDEFDFYWQGQQLTADWHVKSGGNTRDPSRCLRIYYGWDEATKQIVIAEMPAHRRTGAS